MVHWKGVLQIHRHSSAMFSHNITDQWQLLERLHSGHCGDQEDATTVHLKARYTKYLRLQRFPKNKAALGPDRQTNVEHRIARPVDLQPPFFAFLPRKIHQNTSHHIQLQRQTCFLPGECTPKGACTFCSSQAALWRSQGRALSLIYWYENLPRWLMNQWLFNKPQAPAEHQVGRKYQSSWRSRSSCFRQVPLDFRLLIYPDMKKHELSRIDFVLKI